jgi:hypothetical protein
MGFGIGRTEAPRRSKFFLLLFVHKEKRVLALRQIAWLQKPLQRRSAGA